MLPKYSTQNDETKKTFLCYAMKKEKVPHFCM